MELTDLNREQKEALISWLKDGLTLSKLQKKLVASFSLHITYMELRLLVDDLNIDLKEYEVEKRKRNYSRQFLEKCLKSNAILETIQNNFL